MFFVKKKCNNQIFYWGWPNGGKKIVKILWQVATSQDATKNHENIENRLKWAQIGAPELGIMPIESNKSAKTRGDIRFGQK